MDAKPNRDIVLLKAPLEVGTKWQDADSSKEIVAVQDKDDLIVENYLNMLIFDERFLLKYNRQVEKIALELFVKFENWCNSEKANPLKGGGAKPRV